MHKYLTRLLIVLALVAPSFAQFGATAAKTVVSATVTDANGTPYAGGSYSALFTGYVGLTPFPPVTLTGDPLFTAPFAEAVTSPITGILDQNGTFSVTLLDNSQINPANTKWKLTVCAKDNVTCLTSTQTISGATLSLTTALSAAATPWYQGIFASLKLGPGGVVFNDGTHQVTAGGSGAASPFSSIGTGVGFQDVTEIGVPATPVSGVDRIYASSVTHVISCITSGGGNCLTAGGGGGTVTTFGSGNLAPLFTTSVATPTATPSQTFSLSTAAANTVFGNCTGAIAAPSYCGISAAMQPTTTVNAVTNDTNVTGSIAAQGLTFGWAGTLSIARGGTGTTTPGLVAGTNITVTGSWPNQTVNATSGGAGTVTTFSSGNLAPLFTASVATATSTPALTYSLSTAAAHTFFGNNTAGTAAPGFQSIGLGDLPALTLAGATFANQGTTTTLLHGNAAGNPSWSGIAVADHTATGTPSATTFLRGDNTWSVPAGGGSPAFNTVTAGTNTAALLVGTGGSLAATGTGSITATNVVGALNVCSSQNYTAGGTVAANTLVVMDLTGRVVTAGTGGGAVYGVAQGAATIGNPVAVCTDGYASLVSDGTVILGNLLVPSTTVAGQGHDSALTSRNSIGEQSGLLGPVTTACTGAGCTAIVSLEGINRAGRQILPAYITGPTSPNGIPQTVTNTPSGGVAGTSVFSVPGVAIDAQSGTSYTVPVTDDVKLLTLNNAAATAVTGFAPANNYTFALENLGAGLPTYTVASGVINGSGTTQIIPQWWFGFHYTDNTNTFMPIMPTFKAFPSCSTGTSALTFTTATGVIGCNSISGGSSVLSGLTAATGANTIANGNNGLQIWNWAPTSNQTQIQFGETTAATGGTLGNQYIFAAKTLLGSTAVPAMFANSLNGSQTFPTLHLMPTWNTTGVVDAGILENVTNTASGAASLLMDLQIGGTSQYKVDKAGITTQLGNASAPTFTATGAGAGYLSLAQGPESCVAGQAANSYCMEAPASIATAYHEIRPAAAATGILHLTAVGAVMTDTITALVNADMPSPMTIAGGFTGSSFTTSGAGSGVLTLNGSTSGSATLTAPAVAGTATNPISITNSLQLPSGTVYNWNADTGISRDAPGIVDIGNGNAGDKSGIIKAGNTVRVAADFTSASNTSLQAITGLSWSLPATGTHTFSFQCDLVYSQATAAAAVAFGIQAATAAPTAINAKGQEGTSLTAFTTGTLRGLATTTATNIVSATPSAFGAIGTAADMFNVTLSGTIENPAATANTFNIMISTATAADLPTVYRGSFCNLQ